MESGKVRSASLMNDKRGMRNDDYNTKQIQFSLLKLKAELYYKVTNKQKEKTLNEAVIILAPQIVTGIMI